MIMLEVNIVPIPQPLMTSASMRVIMELYVEEPTAIPTLLPKLILTGNVSDFNNPLQKQTYYKFLISLLQAQSPY